MSARAPHYLDVGQPLIPGAIVRPPPLSTPIDITGAQTAEVLARRPSGVETVHAGEVHDGPRGEVVAYTVAEQLDETGRWTIQAHVIMPDGSEYHGPVTSLWVNANLNGDTGIPEGVSSHGHRHGPGGEDEIPGVTFHAPRHHHDGDMALRIDDLATATSWDHGGFASMYGAVQEGLTGAGRVIPFSPAQAADVLAPSLQETLRPVRRSIISLTTGTTSVSDNHHHRMMRASTSGSRTVMVGDGPAARTDVLYSVEHAGASITFAQGSGVQLYGNGLTIYQGEMARVLYLTTTVAIVLPLREHGRLRPGTITASETHSPTHHGQLRTYAGAGAAVVTFGAGRPMDATAYRRMGSGALTFVGDGVTLIIPDGLAAEVVSSGRVVATYESETEVRLEGWLAEAP